MEDSPTRAAVFSDEVRLQLPALGLPVKSLAILLDRLHEHLELAALDPAARADRDPADPDTLFRFCHSLFVGGRMRLFVFSVCDTVSPDHFFIEGVVAT